MDTRNQFCHSKPSNSSGNGEILGNRSKDKVSYSFGRSLSLGLRRAKLTGLLTDRFINLDKAVNNPNQGHFEKEAVK